MFGGVVGGWVRWRDGDERACQRQGMDEHNQTTFQTAKGFVYIQHREVFLKIQKLESNLQIITGVVRALGQGGGFLSPSSLHHPH